jgi:assimilatory nitrate reductase catalytic subunit
MGFTPPDIDRVRRFWKAPRIATHEGLKAVQMFEAVARGEIKALWVMGTNPAVSLPNADGVREALKKLELFVVPECSPTIRYVGACAVAGAGRGRKLAP